MLKKPLYTVLSFSIIFAVTAPLRRQKHLTIAKPEPAATKSRTPNRMPDSLKPEMPNFDQMVIDEIKIDTPDSVYFRIEPHVAEEVESENDRLAQATVTIFASTGKFSDGGLVFEKKALTYEYDSASKPWEHVDLILQLDEFDDVETKAQVLAKVVAQQLAGYRNPEKEVQYFVEEIDKRVFQPLEQRLYMDALYYEIRAQNSIPQTMSFELRGFIDDEFPNFCDFHPERCTEVEYMDSDY